MGWNETSRLFLENPVNLCVCLHNLLYATKPGPVPKNSGAPFKSLGLPLKSFGQTFEIFCQLLKSLGLKL